MTARDTAPTWCPARPIRCRPDETAGGLWTCTTRSTAPISMPSSRLLVATTARSRPDFRSSSISRRRSLLTLPWCARASNAGAPDVCPAMAITSAGGRRGGSRSVEGPAAAARSSAHSSFSRVVRRSDSRRELVNTRVADVPSIWSTMDRSTCGHTEGGAGGASGSSVGMAVGGCARSATGTVMRNSNCLAETGVTVRTGRPPARKSATTSTGRTVAEHPMRCTGRSTISSRRSRDRARCEPRLLPARE